MKRTLVTYRVKPECVEENEALVHAVYDGLRALDDPGVHYATYKQDDGRTFVHLACFDPPEKQARLTDSPAFKAFQKDLKARCELPPTPQPLTRVDGFGLP